MSLRRFRIEVEGVDQEDVEQQLDYFSKNFMFASQLEKNQKLDFECTDENVKAIQRNGIPFMYGRRVFLIKEVKDEGRKS